MIDQGEVAPRKLGEEFKAEAVDDFRRLILKEWENPEEQSDGTITAKGRLAYPSRLFACQRAREGFTRGFNRVTPNKPIDADRMEFAKVWKGNEELEEYEKNYAEAADTSKAIDEKYGFSERDRDTNLGYSWGSILELKDNDDFVFIRNDLQVARAYHQTNAVRLEKGGNGRLLTFTFGVRDLRVQAIYNSEQLKGGIGMIAIRQGVGRSMEAHGINETAGAVELGFNGEDRVPYILKKEITDSFGNWRYLEPLDIPDQAEETVMGRRTMIKNNPDSVHFTVYQLSNPEKIDFEMDIPKQQDFETLIDHADRDVVRFDFEDKLIPEELRRKPFQKPGDFDDMWMYADVPALLGVDIKKHNIES